MQVVFRANCKDLNCCEKWQVDVVTLNIHGGMLLLILIPLLSIFFIHPGGGAFNHIVLKESTLTYITMLINRTLPFCGR